MDRSKIWQYIPIFIMFTWMMITPFLFPRNWMIRYSFNMVGMVLSISLLVVTNEVLKWKASEFTHYDCICRPSGNRLHLFVTILETVELSPGWYATALTLGEKQEHSFYGAIDKGGQVVINHWGEWEKRMILGKGKALFKDQVVDHNKSAIIVLHEPADTFDMDHLSPIPVFLLKDAPGDFYLTEDYNLLTAMAGDFIKKKVWVKGKEVSGATVLHGYQTVKRENENLKTRNQELQRQSLHWHSQAVRWEEVLKQVKNELHSVLSSKSDMKQSVIEQVLTCLEAHTKIRNALKELKGTNWLSKGAIMLIGAIMVMGVFLMNPGGIMEWMGVAQNQFFIIVLVIGSISAYVYINQQRKR